MKKMMLLAVALVALIASPAAAQYGGGTLVLSESAIAPGGDVEVTCTGLEPGVAYSFTFDGDEVGTGTVDDDGTAFGTFTTASDQAPGTFDVAIVTDSGSCTGTLTIEGSGGGTDPGGNEPGGNESGGNEPGGNEPGGNEPGGNEPGFTDGTNGTPGTNAGTTGSGTLPRTGSSDSIRTMAMVGAGLLALGGMVALTTRRKATA